MLVQVAPDSYIHVAQIFKVQLLNVEDVTKKVLKVTDFLDVTYTELVDVSVANTRFVDLVKRVNNTYTAYYKLLHPSDSVPIVQVPPVVST